MEEETRCELCYGEIIINNKVLACVNCKQVIGKLSNMRDKQNNKIIHLNNVLKSIEIANVTELDNLLESLKNDIISKNINPEYVGRTYITNFLKKKNIPSYIKALLLHNRYQKKEFQLTDEIKENIKIVFLNYNSYINNFSPIFTENSISYELILYLIIKRLDINLDFRPCATKSVNDKLIKSFNDFENYLCEKYKDYNTGCEKIFCLPTFNLQVYDPNLLY